MLPAKPNEPNAILREYELPNGDKGSKWEIPFLNWTGIIRGLRFKDGDFGETCSVEFDDAYLQMNTADRYFQDFACKIFNADLAQPLTLHPYDMTVENDKKVRGISLQQNGEKLKNYFYDYEQKKNLHGFPEVDEVKKVKKTYWKTYFIEVTDFLTEELAKLKFVEAAPKTTSDYAEEAFAPEEMPPDDLPF